jgi:hypothetical protein
MASNKKEKVTTRKKHWTQTKAGRLKLGEIVAARKTIKQNKQNEPLELGLIQTPQTPSVDLRRVEEYNYRRGLMTAIECILRELK